jgi:hypothetical protein
MLYNGEDERKPKLGASRIKRTAARKKIKDITKKSKMISGSRYGKLQAEKEALKPLTKQKTFRMEKVADPSKASSLKKSVGTNKVSKLVPSRLATKAKKRIGKIERKQSRIIRRKTR